MVVFGVCLSRGGGGVLTRLTAAFSPATDTKHSVHDKEESHGEANTTTTNTKSNKKTSKNEATPPNTTTTTTAAAAVASSSKGTSQPAEE
ncbi:hypothetical protein E2C01_085212 [Portunus trituberculatus]|uniref:Uncharacterized protein n=1 Tax=Portunus trituberculatus TaxID=210409 RepID=A0A5B7J888_PORTR|nr:hypothetical protein [Portunus trituberculatus]